MTTTPQEPAPDAPDGPILDDRAEAAAIQDRVADDSHRPD